MSTGLPTRLAKIGDLVLDLNLIRQARWDEWTALNGVTTRRYVIELNTNDFDSVVFQPDISAQAEADLLTAVATK